MITLKRGKVRAYRASKYIVCNHYCVMLHSIKVLVQSNESNEIRSLFLINKSARSASVVIDHKSEHIGHQRYVPGTWRLTLSHWNDAYVDLRKIRQTKHFRFVFRFPQLSLNNSVLNKSGKKDRNLGNFEIYTANKIQLEVLLFFSKDKLVLFCVASSVSF